MKTMKKITTLMLTICLLVGCFSLSAFAADGKIMFTDPQAKTGEMVEVTGVVQKTAGNFGKIEIVMKYDTSMMKFQNGEGITETEAGVLTYNGDATNDVGNRKEFKFSFEALKEGTTKIEITSATIKNVSGTVLDYTKGSATVTIAEGESAVTTTTTTVTPSEDAATIEVNGVSYKISNEFPEEAIPEGYEKATLDYDMVEYQVVYSEEFGLTLAYLVNEENLGAFFMYVEADATFAPYEEIKVSDSTTIALLSDVTDIVLPEEYKATTVVLNDHEFPAWQTENSEGFCVLYAINNYGEKSLYQLDNTEGTYQRFVAPEVENEIPDDSFIGRLSSLLENHLDYVILGVGLGFLVFLLVIIVLGVKLYNRNAELDEIYDEYGLDMDEKTEDDVFLDLDEEEEDEYEEEDEFDAGEGIKEIMREAEPVVQTEMRELTQEVVDEITEQSAKQTESENEETSLGTALKEVAAQKDEQEEDFDDDDIFENFSIDFIDLDD